MTLATSQLATDGCLAQARSTADWPEPLYIEISPLLVKQLTGIGRFVARLIEALARLTSLRLINTIEGEQAESMRLSNALPCDQEILVSRASLPAADGDLRSWSQHLFYCPRQPLDRIMARRSAAIYTMLRPDTRYFRRELAILYDFTPMVLPWAHVKETRSQFGRLFTSGALLCDNVIAISRSTKHDASWMCSADAEQVVVGYPGPSLCLDQHGSARAMTRRKDVLLVVSALEPRKNGLFLFDWFMNSQALGSQFELWWVGPQGWHYQKLLKTRRRNHGRNINFLGVVSDAKLCELYRQATMTAYPSLYEGFGFPVLDSLRHGTPVLCAYNSSLQEFEGPGVFFFDACNPQSLDEAYQEAHAAAPATLVRTDLDREFSWDALARRVLALCA
jgi:glycosyltransferase involved in cell wall biosynthesis